MTHVKSAQNQTAIIETDMSGFKEKNTKDFWIEEGNQVVRVHNKKRSKLFDPKESPNPTIPEHMLKDESRTMRVSLNDEDAWKDYSDNWRIANNNHVNSKGLKWTRRTIFQKRWRKQYLSAPSPSPSNMSTVPLKEMFVAGHISSIGTKGRGVGSVTLIMKGQRGKRDKQYRSESNAEDF